MVEQTATNRQGGPADILKLPAVPAEQPFPGSNMPEEPDVCAPNLEVAIVPSYPSHRATREMVRRLDGILLPGTLRALASGDAFCYMKQGPDADAAIAKRIDRYCVDRLGGDRDEAEDICDAIRTGVKRGAERTFLEDAGLWTLGIIGGILGGIGIAWAFGFFSHKGAEDFLRLKKASSEARPVSRAGRAIKWLADKFFYNDDDKNGPPSTGGGGGSPVITPSREEVDRYTRPYVTAFGEALTRSGYADVVKAGIWTMLGLAAARMLTRAVPGFLNITPAAALLPVDDDFIDGFGMSFDCGVIGRESKECDTYRRNKKEAEIYLNMI